MNQMTTFILVFTGISLLFYVMGVATDKNPFMTMLLTPQSLSNTTIWSLITVAALTTGLSIYIGIWFKNAELAAMTAVAPVVASQIWYFANVINLLLGYGGLISVITLLFTAPIAYLFVVSVVDYWRGRD